MRRQNYGSREPKKPRQERAQKAPEPSFAITPKLAPLEKRECPYRKLPGHADVICPACEGFPLD